MGLSATGDRQVSCRHTRPVEPGREVYQAVRVIAGHLRGARFDAPPGQSTRPITDRVKETIFNIIGHRLGRLSDLSGLGVLDLFAGSGAFGIECLSRGAADCLFVERDRRAVRVLRRNLARLRLANARVAVENAWTMRIPPAPGGGYHLVFVDPPYRDADDPLRLADLFERLSPRLDPQGLVIFRHEARSSFDPEQLDVLRCVDDRVIGSMRLLLLAPRGE